MTILRRIFVILAVHLLFFSAWPDTGQSGVPYLLVSLAAWSAAAVLTKVFSIPLLSSVLRPAIDLAMAAAAALVISLTMPQKDGIKVFEKIRLGDIPTVHEVAAGLTGVLTKISSWRQK
ncbi:MAG: hypothetical protein ABIG11_06240 [bacterium]